MGKNKSVYAAKGRHIRYLETLREIQLSHSAEPALLFQILSLLNIISVEREMCIIVEERREVNLIRIRHPPPPKAQRTVKRGPVVTLLATGAGCRIVVELDQLGDEVVDKLCDHNPIAEIARNVPLGPREWNLINPSVQVLQFSLFHVHGCRYRACSRGYVTKNVTIGEMGRNERKEKYNFQI